MGKYRTFSKKVSNFNGASGRVVLRNDSAKFFLDGSSSGKRTELQNWIKGRPQLHTHRSQLLQFLKQSPLFSFIGLFACTLLFLAQPVTLSPVSTSFAIVEDDNTSFGGQSSGTSNRSAWIEAFIERYIELHRQPRNCTSPSSEEFPPDLFSKEERQHGAIVLHFFGAFYMLYALLLVCDVYFVPAIESICEQLQVPRNIAGATFMAISTSAPELFTNVIGTFVTKGDLGVGTIVGSAVFNVLAVGACVGIGTNFAVKTLPLGGANPSNKWIRKRDIPLDWWSLTRDSVYYLLSVATLIVVLYDGRVYWQEGLIMLIIYGFYIAGMCYDMQCRAIAETCLGKVQNTISGGSSRKISSVIKKVIDDENAPLISHGHGSRDSCYGSQTPSPILSDTETNDKPTVSLPSSKRASLAEMIVPSKEHLDSDSLSSLTSSFSSVESPTLATHAILGGIKDVIAFPLKFLLSWTIPNCRVEKNKKWCGLALLACVAWIGALSYFISWMVCVIGETLEIPDSVSGLTFLAAGTSFPEVLSSVIVARQGFGSMGLSSSIGSNTFDILVCLGLPWLIQAAILTSQDINYIEIHSGGLAYSAALLITSLIFLYIMIAANGYHLDSRIGICCVIMYVIFITVACLVEMNVFFPVNLPPC